MNTSQIEAALTERCGLCGAKPGQPCRNTLQPELPLHGRTVHFYRITNTNTKGTP
jgi:hypothetical protein